MVHPRLSSLNLFAAPTSASWRWGLVAAVLMLAMAQPAKAQAGRSMAFDIPAQDASSALLQLCLAADCELAFIPGPGHSVRTKAVRGSMGWRVALAQMLDGTDLRYRFVGSRGVRVWVAAPAPPPRPSEAIGPTEVRAVEVVGRLSDQIDTGLSRKRAADVISDVVASDRIGDLPAANLAEALQRVPGVAIEREVGEGQFVSVRGLGPLFQSVTLNGAPVAFNENIRNSTQSGRQFRFRALSVDLLAGARLTKSSTPDLIDGGIGSNIDIETAGGLDGEPFLSLRLGGEASARSDRVGADLSMAGRIVSADGEMGLIAGVSQETRSVRYDRFQIMRYGQTVIDGELLATPNDVRTTVEQEERRRRSLFVGADWRLSPDVRLDFDGLVSTFDNAIREDRLVFGLGAALAEPGAVARAKNGVVTAASIPEGQIDNNTEFSDQSHLNVLVSVGADIALGDWRLTPRLSASHAHSVLDTPLERFSTESPQGVAYAFELGDAAQSRRAAGLTTTFDLLNPANLTLNQLGIRAVESRDADMTAVFDAERRFDHGGGRLGFTALSLGVQVSDRSRDYDRRDRRAIPLADDGVVVGFYTGATPSDVFSDLVALRATPWATADFGRLRPAFRISDPAADIVFQPGDVVATGADQQNSYEVGEQVAAAYLRLDIEGRVMARRLFGNLGVRVIETRTHVEGARLERVGDLAQVRPVTFDGEHRAVLPSLNLALDLDEVSILRVAASRSITRPSLADLRASTVPASVLVSAIYEDGEAAVTDPEDGHIFSGVGGNPALTPYVSTNFDLSYEVTGRRTSVSVAYFHKTIDDFIETAAAPEVLVFETQAGPLVEAEVLMSRPHNVGRATIDGVELGLHQRLAYGLGLWASATWTQSRLDGGGRLTGVSDWSWSVSPYLERGPLSVNLSWSWRSPFRSEADMQGGGVSDFTVGAAGYLDAQAVYALPAQAELVLSATNLTDTRELAYEGSKDRLLQLGSVGRQASVGVRWIW
ncbi:MAG: TonB-dependent receptor [Phenylobacterium sp.]|uniref:TonB-dependent receptor n=1 Tax=Phenylobacterium sp. TaxID=1871053 RepID=UPI002728852E|nr:TonB-dependent receptor [Phenylobacterium sp.]MDO8411075.1 TonB-dependent receptor [Phenylobacterium sp.]